jgi:hypothetical protein
MQEIWKTSLKTVNSALVMAKEVMPEETKSKPLPLAAVAIAMTPLRETADFYPPPSVEEDWDKYPEMGNIE